MTSSLRRYGSQSVVGPLRRVLVRRPDAAFAVADPDAWHYTARPDLAAAQALADPLLAAASMGAPYAVAPTWIYAAGPHGPQLIRDGHLIVEAGMINAVNAGPAPAGLLTLSLPGHLLLPGLISGHTHVAGGTPTRGIIEGGRSFALPHRRRAALRDHRRRRGPRADPGAARAARRRHPHPGDARSAGSVRPRARRRHPHSPLPIGARNGDGAAALG
jgi:hypothetical protein